MTTEYPIPTVTITCSDEMKNVWGALFKFQGSTQGVVRDSVNPGYKNSKYASLEAVIDTARPGLQAVGIVFLQAPGIYADGCFSVETMFVHAASGEWIRFTTGAPLAKVDPQGVGSAITYFCRYSLMAALGLPPLDDDGEATRRPEAYTTLAGARNQGPISAMADLTPISEQQRTTLAKMVDDGKADLDRFLMVMKVETLADIPASQYQRAKDLLQQKVDLVKQIEEAKQKKQATDNGRTARHA